MSLLLAIAAATQAAPPPLTLEEAQSLSPSGLASRVLGAAGAIYREAHIHPGGGPFGAPMFTSITFATVPRSAGFPGLCVADRLYVSLEPIGPGPGDTPRRPRRLDTDQVYRIVGDTTDRREGTEESENALEAQCARSGPVLDDASRLLFFGNGLNGANAYMAARMLQTVIAAARREPIEHLTCVEDDADPAARACADPRALLASLRADRLRQAEIDRCEGNPAHLCANLTFQQRMSSGDTFKTLQVVIEADVGRADPPPAVFRVLAVTIRHDTWIED